MIDRVALSLAILDMCGPGATLVGDDQVEMPDGKMVSVKSLKLTKKTDEIETENAWRKLRQDRDRLLSACDWSQLPDAKVDRDVWATYRQELRDLPDLTTDPFNPNWPKEPE